MSDGIRPGVFCIHQGAWPDLALDEGGICKNGAVNVLTKDLPSSKLGNGCAGNTALAWVEKYEGRRLPLRRLIRLPAHDPRRVLGIILPGAVFDAKTLSMIEIHRPHVFLIHLQS